MYLKKGEFKEMSTTLYYVRHGRAVCNTKDYFYDDSKEPLIALGRAQAADAGRKLKKASVRFDAIYCSPYERAKETCRIALMEMGLKDYPVRYDARLVERDFGELYGRTVSERHYRELYDYTSERSEIDGVETLEKLEDRARWFMHDVRTLYPDGNVLVFAHGALGLAYRAAVYGRPESGSLFDFELLKNGEIMRLVL